MYFQIGDHSHRRLIAVASQFFSNVLQGRPHLVNLSVSHKENPNASESSFSPPLSGSSSLPSELPLDPNISVPGTSRVIYATHVATMSLVQSVIYTGLEQDKIGGLFGKFVRYRLS